MVNNLKKLRLSQINQVIMQWYVVEETRSLAYLLLRVKFPIQHSDAVAVVKTQAFTFQFQMDTFLTEVVLYL